ncbi:MAG TPA: PAS domain S-box protein [Candidatus Polarisedimenticolia bacterium]|nr:PAS domain S-box protein [Candidatus Polarisedimenticolia bacterium]
MAVPRPLRSTAAVESFMAEYYAAWGGTDEARILSYYTEDVTVQIPGRLMQGTSAVLEQFVRPFITGFPGNRHDVRNMIFGRNVVTVEFVFAATHSGPFAGRAATEASIQLPGCGVYEYDPAARRITAARVYFDVGTLLKQLLERRSLDPMAAEAAAAPPGTISTPVEHLDLATVLEVSQSVSGEMILERLLDTLMRTAVEHARAERALLILSRQDGLRIAAEATTRGHGVTVRLGDEPVGPPLLPEMVVRHVLHARESVILDDAVARNPFAADPYLASRHARSILCLPLMNQAKLVGALYLENDSAPRVFAPARIAVLKLPASQAAVSLENSRLYRDLAERGARIRRLVDANIIGIIIWEIEGRILEANDAFLAMVGYDREDLNAGRLRWTDLTPPEWRDRDEQQWLPELKGRGALQPFEKEYFRKDRSRVPVLIGAAAFDETGSHGVAYVLDLSERKRAERALLEREREAGLILETIPGMAAVLTPAGEVAAVNHELVDYCGQPLEGMRQWGTNGTVHADDLSRIVPIFTEAIASGRPYDFEARIRRHDGAYRWCLVRGLPLRGTDGGIVRWYVLLSDVDDRKRAEETIERTRSELAHSARDTTFSALTASIAHEVNQPLAGIITNAGTCLRMLDGLPPDLDGARETARRTTRDAHRAAEVITRLRALFGKREFAPEPLDLNEAAREVLALSGKDLQRNNVVLRTELAEGLPRVSGDRIQLQQVILNLVRNASDAMADVKDRPRELGIRTGWEDDGHVRLTVRDAGVGLATQEAHSHFEAFHTTKSDGMGIGLFVSHSIIERHGGRLWAEPNQGAPGTTFSFSIPLRGA